MVQTLLYFYQKLEEIFLRFSKSNLFILSYLLYIMNAKSDSSASDISILKTVVYA